MKLLFDLFPLILFFAAYKFYDIYVATGVAIAAAFVQVVVFWLKHRRFEKMHVITLAALAVFGGLTILLRDPVFIKWKTTIVYWIMGSIILFSQFVTKRTVIEALIGDKLQLPRNAVRMFNLHWAVFAYAVGALNIYVAFYYGLDLDESRREEIWVNFKVFGVLVLTVVFMVVEIFLMARMAAKNDQVVSASETDR
ncbi:MAG: septation protein A [Acidiferrobacterales bacterium]|nr:septation protein A [Acidiferrobacterales bacterium]